MATSYNGWPLSPARSSRTVPGTSVSFVVADGPAGDVLMYVAAEFHKRVEPLDAAKDDWGYVLKPNVNNPSVWSCHASATALDLNATKHPNGKGNTFTSAQYAEIRKILAEVSNTVVQLVGYDEMHFEVRGTKAEVAAAAAKLKASTPAPTKAPRPTVKQGSSGDDVKLVQRFLGVAYAGDPGYGTFGPATDVAVRQYQRRQGLEVDGIVGPATWDRIISGLGGTSSGNLGSSSGVRPTLQRGVSGSEVEELQAFLNRVFPSYSSLAVDSVFGAGTESVVREFQRRSGLPDTGIVDAATWKRLGF